MLLLGLTLVPTPVASGKSHGPVPAIIGLCKLVLTLSGGSVPLVPIPPASVTWNVNASGPCDDNHTSGMTGTISGSVSSVMGSPASCAVGMFGGSLNVHVSGAIGTVSTQATLVVVGAVLTLAGTGPSQFVGGGVFVNGTLTGLSALTVPVPLTVLQDVQQCVTSGTDSTLTWTGVYQFIDPS